MTIWKQLSIYTSEGTRWGVRPLHEAVVATALDQDVYSACVFKSMAGFGPQLAIPTANRMALPTDLPIEVRLVGPAAVIEGFLATQGEMLQGCLATLVEVEVVQAVPGV